MTRATLEHAAECAGHHCLECGACLGFDPREEADGDEPLEAVALCGGCGLERLERERAP